MASNGRVHKLLRVYKNFKNLKKIKLFIDKYQLKTNTNFGYLKSFSRLK